MRKIGIFTPVGVYNYGTKLQALAMQEIIRKKGFDTEIVLLNEKKGIIGKFKYLIGKTVYLIFHDLHANRRYNKYIREYYPDLQSKDLIKSLKQRLASLEKSDKDYTIIRFIDKSDLKRHTSLYKAVVCGSDQIWHPITNRNDFWTLQLVDDTVPRISYAPSLGIDSIPKDAIPFFRNFLKTFSHISVRELSGAHLIQGLTEKKVHVVLDPTLLAGRTVWDKLLENNMEITNASYCLCYMLGTNAHHREVVKEVAKKLNLVIYNFSHFKKFNEADEHLGCTQLFDITPSQFVSLISKAKFVITDSFHCTAFSAMYHIPFITLLRYGKSDYNSTNSRVYSLLSQFNLENRILSENADLDEILNSKIDFDNFEMILAQKRIESNSYLDNALNEL